MKDDNNNNNNNDKHNNYIEHNNSPGNSSKSPVNSAVPTAAANKNDMDNNATKVVAEVIEPESHNNTQDNKTNVPFPIKNAPSLRQIQTAKNNKLKPKRA